MVKIAKTISGFQPSVVTLNENSSAIDQINIFNSFDILITSHGSQLTNLIFSLKRMVILELVPCVQDLSFVSNAHQMGHIHAVSSGHSVTENCPGKHGILKDKDISTYDNIIR